MSGLEVVFYDLGNTLVDYHRGSDERDKADRGLALMSHYLYNCGISLDKEELYDKFYRPWVIELFPKRINRRKEFDLVGLLRNIIKKDTPDYARLIALFHQPYREDVREMDGAGETLRELRFRGIKLGIISNTPLPGFCHDMTLERLGLLEYIPLRFYSYDREVRKPYKEIFIQAAAGAGYPLSRTAMVGDSIRADMDTPSQLGMKTFLYDPRGRFDTSRDHGYDIISHHREILSRL